MNLTSHRVLWLLSFFTIGLMVGCTNNEDANLYLVQGTVELDGESLQDGDILFLPTDGRGASAGTKIINGCYEVKMPPGPKAVEITSVKEIPPKRDGGMPDYKSLVPPKYNSKTILECTVEESREEGANTIPFSLESRPKK